MLWFLPPSAPKITRVLNGWATEDSMNLARQEATRLPAPTGFGSAGPELVALKAGLKPLVRQRLSDSELQSMKAHGLPDGLVYEIAPRVMHGGRMVFFSFDPACAREGARLETTRDSRAQGLLLGYPPCCVAAFEDVPAGWFRKRTNMALLRASAKRTGSSAWAPRLNVLDLHGFHYLSHWPCRFDCAPSLDFANRMADEMATRHHGWLSEPSPCKPDCKLERALRDIDEALGAHRLVLREEVQVSIRGRFEGPELHVTAAWPTYRDDVDSHTSRKPADVQAALTATAAILAAGRIELRDNTLLLGGQEALRCPGAVLAPFGTGS